ncbi:Uncharacterised protein [Serratia plymuthica]|nr:Uncharacterised protein [Serratia plymuthica]VEI19098.1 Uncharacterised protein [Serratia plymuthica]
MQAISSAAQALRIFSEEIDRTLAQAMQRVHELADRVRKG